MEHDKEQEGMSTGKKVVAGAAVGLAVPAAVGVAKKLLSDGDDGDASQQQQGSRQQSRSQTRTRATARSPRTGSTRGKTRARSTTSGKRSSSSTRSRSSSSRRTSGSSSGSGRTKEQLYNQAKRLNIEGRSSMTKAQLERAISRKRS
jgi:hypothetical protein